jgi:monofunctional biosynthetic peptidoglycan transglycosylase
MPTDLHLLFDFSEAAAGSGWRAVDDVVMGGVSDSDLIAASPDTAAFEGTVSLDRGGGFASVRSPQQSWDLNGFSGLLLRAKGDGKRYKLTVYTDASGISYRYPFEAEDDWETYFAPFDAFTPMRRGREVPDAPPLDPSTISTVGFLISDKQAGPFRLELRWIQAATQS